MEWTFLGRPITEDMLEGQIGFVYVIENLFNNRKYIGKKLLRFSKTKQVKGKKKKIKVDSDWKEYFGSSEELKKDVENLGEENFKREILGFYRTKGLCSYYELKNQLQFDVLLHPDKYYNSYVGGRIHRSHLKINQ